ncbi:branched-chain amino acid ABC transporter permease [Arhodomonas sp. SL1]|uniref:branched-chain amino acid ABC transporter permease n=1 Tax=Arhodomonas sp. SL1 TaxID=3425691 RepID=UPI003F885A8E
MRGSRLLLILAVALIAVLPLIAPWSKTFLVLALAKGLAVLGIVVLLRAGQVSFGHALFFAASAYVAAFAARALSGGELITLLVIGAFGSGVLGLLVGLFVVRYRYIFFGMLNLAFSMVFYAILEKFYHYTGGSDGLTLPRPTILGVELERQPFEYALFYVALGVAVVLTYLVHRYLRSAPGQALAAIKTNETRLEYLGVSPRGILLVAYVISAMLAGVGGVLAAAMQGLVTPEYAFWVRSGEFVFIAILGGAGHVVGAFAGALVYEGVRMYAAAYAAGMWQLLLGAALLVIVLFASEGLVGLWRRVRGRVVAAGRVAP